MTRCSSEERGYFGESHLCECLVDETGRHRGYHQQITGGPGYTYGRQWSDGGSWGLGREHDTTCGNCGALNRSNDVTDGICDRCRGWLEGRAGYFAGTDFVIRGTLYRHNRHAGAFGDQPTHVVLDDGREYHDTRTWHIATVPWEFRDLWPDNARFVREGRSYPTGSPLDAWATDEERKNAS